MIQIRRTEQTTNNLIISKIKQSVIQYEINDYDVYLLPNANLTEIKTHLLNILENYKQLTTKLYLQFTT
jgi:hypothetical protein